MQSDLLGAWALGMRNCLCLSGDHQMQGAGGKLNGHPNAKNVSHPEGFSEETLKLLDWMKDQPDLMEIYTSDRRHIEGGAFRLIARYYLDSKMAAKSIKYYFRAFTNWPSYTLKHILRILYAILMLIGIESPADRYYSHKTKQSNKDLVQEIRKEFSNSKDNVVSLPGLNLE